MERLLVFGGFLAKKIIQGRNLKSLFPDENDKDKLKGTELYVNPSSLLSDDSQKADIPDEVKWEEVIERIKMKSNPQSFFWFDSLKLVSQRDESITLKAKSPFERDWITNRYLDLISKSVEEVGGKKFEIKIIFDNQAPTSVEEVEEEPKPREMREALFSGFLNQNYTFERFIVGQSNQFAHAASIAVARKPGEAYNPLFIYGGVGLGKTHLINAIGNHILKTTLVARICCISAENFTNQVINSIKSNKMEEFRNRYRFGCDVLLIDDIQFIAGKESTQEEFFHTFNTLYESKKQIVISSDKSPKDMSYLEERLRSRFEWGLITDIQPPETETKVAILKKKAEAEMIMLPDDVAIFLAQNITSNVRELEGTLTNITAYAKLLNTEITIELAREVLKNIIKEHTRQAMSIESIQKEVANFFGIKLYELKSEKKMKNVALPRQVAMYLARRYTGASFPEIGEKFGGKDHSTVIHAVRKIENMIGEDSSLKEMVNAVSRRIEAGRSG